MGRHKALRIVLSGWGPAVQFCDLRLRQRDIVSFIVCFSHENGYAPTIRQIGDATGITSTCVVNYNLDALVKTGWLRRGAFGESRAFKVLHDIPLELTGT